MEPKIKEKGVCIRIKVKEWLGNPEGAKMHVWEHVAKELYDRGVCEILDEKVKVEFDGGELTEVKEVKEPPKNKMVGRPQKSK